MRNRVLKRTFYKLGIVLGVMGGAISYGIAAMYIGDKFFGSKEGGLFGFYIGGVIAIFIHCIYKDAKREIQYEDEKLLDRIKNSDKRVGNPYDELY